MERFMDLTRRLCFVVAVVLAVTALGQESEATPDAFSLPHAAAAHYNRRFQQSKRQQQAQVVRQPSCLQ
jgi:Skp family chaperone for outer membrane proteins